MTIESMAVSICPGVKSVYRRLALHGCASFRWSFGPLSAWGSIESTTILTTHPSLLLALWLIFDEDFGDVFENSFLRINWNKI